MKKAAWKKRILSQMEDAGNYKPAFDSVIDTLAAILEQRDSAYDEYIADGCRACIEKVSDRGAKNIAKNPRLQTWQDLNTTALAYWRECCLTPAAFKKACLSSVTAQDRNSFDKLLDKMLNEN